MPSRDEIWEMKRKAFAEARGNPPPGAIPLSKIPGGRDAPFHQPSPYQPDPTSDIGRPTTPPDHRVRDIEQSWSENVELGNPNGHLNVGPPRDHLHPSRIIDEGSTDYEIHPDRNDVGCRGMKECVKGEVYTGRRLETSNEMRDGVFNWKENSEQNQNSMGQGPYNGGGNGNGPTSTRSFNPITGTPRKGDNEKNKSGRGRSHYYGGDTNSMNDVLGGGQANNVGNGPNGHPNGNYLSTRNKNSDITEPPNKMKPPQSTYDNHNYSNAPNSTDPNRSSGHNIMTNSNVNLDLSSLQPNTKKGQEREENMMHFQRHNDYPDHSHRELQNQNPQNPNLAANFKRAYCAPDMQTAGRRPELVQAHQNSSNVNRRTTSNNMFTGGNVDESQYVMRNNNVGNQRKVMENGYDGNQMNNEMRTAGGARDASSNCYADGRNQNCGNVLTDRSTTRVNNPPGGASTICLG